MTDKTIAEVVSQVSVDMVNMQRVLFDAGLIATAAAVNIASQRLGWEAALLLERSQCDDR